jgi:hypothetical protein
MLESIIALAVAFVVLSGRRLYVYADRYNRDDFVWIFQNLGIIMVGLGLIAGLFFIRILSGGAYV